MHHSGYSALIAQDTTYCHQSWRRRCASQSFTQLAGICGVGGALPPEEETNQRCCVLSYKPWNTEQWLACTKVLEVTDYFINLRHDLESRAHGDKGANNLTLLRPFGASLGKSSFCKGGPRPRTGQPAPNGLLCVVFCFVSLIFFCFLSLFFFLSFSLLVLFWIQLLTRWWWLFSRGFFFSCFLFSFFQKEKVSMESVG